VSNSPRSVIVLIFAFVFGAYLVQASIRDLRQIQATRSAQGSRRQLMAPISRLVFGIDLFGLGLWMLAARALWTTSAGDILAPEWSIPIMIVLLIIAVPSGLMVFGYRMMRQRKIAS
jgi:uncharacterized integral membrane protein